MITNQFKHKIEIFLGFKVAQTIHAHQLTLNNCIS